MNPIYFKEPQNRSKIFLIVTTVVLIAINLIAFLTLGYARHQNDQQAQVDAQLQRHILRVEEKNSSLSEKVMRAHSPRYLIQNLPKGLRPHHSSQIVIIGSGKSTKVAEGK